MIYGYEQPVQYTPVEVFNPTAANMVLQSMGQYADVLQREHERALQEEKEFLKEYGDFSSAVPGATEAFYNESVGKVRNALAIAQQNGIDLTRSPEGRAVLSRIINSVNVGKLNQLKQQKEAYDQFQKSANEALQKGDATPEYINSLLEQYNLNGFSAIKNSAVQPWTLTSVPKYEGVDAFSDRIFGDIKNTYLDTDGAFDYTGVGTKQMQSALAINLPNYLATPSGRYELNNFINSLPNRGEGMTNVEKIQAFNNDIIARAADRYSHATRELNPIWKMNEEQKNEKDLIDYRGNAKNSDNGGSGSGGGSGGSGGGQTDYSYDRQQYYFNYALSKLLGEKVTTVSFARKDALNTMKQTQMSVVNQFYDKDSKKYKVNDVLNRLSDSFDVNEIASVLGLRQTTDDAKAGVYSINTNELRHAYSPTQLFSKFYGVNAKSDGKAETETIKKNINDAKTAKVTPTGDVVSYLRKDGSVKQMAKVNIDLLFEEKPVRLVMYMDMGTTSTEVTNDPSVPIAIDRNRSTLRSANWNTVTKKYATPKHWDFGVQDQYPEE